MTPYISPEEWERRKLALAIQNSTEQPPNVQTPPVSYPNLGSPEAPIAPVNPATSINASPRMQYEALRQQEPKISEYHPSKLRQFLAGLAGVGAGLGTGNLGAGLGVAKQIKYGPFLSQERNFGQELAKARDIVGSTEEGQKTTAALTESAARRAAQEATAKAQAARQKREEVTTESMIPGTEAFQGSLEKLGMKPTSMDTNLFDLNLADGSTVQGARAVKQIDTSSGTPTVTYAYIGPNNHRYSGDMVKGAVKSSPGTRSITAFREAIDAFTKDKGRLPKIDEVYEIQKKLAESTAEGSGTLQERQARTQLDYALARKNRLESEAKTLSPEEIQEAKDFRDRDPLHYGDYLSKLSPEARKIAMREVPPQNLPDRNAQTRINNASTALGHVANLRDMIEDPVIKNNLGPILGRLEVIRSKVGGEEKDDIQIKGDSYTHTELEQKFLTYLTQNVLWETASGVGTRPARQTIEMIKGTAANAHQTYDRLKGSLDGQELSAQTVIDSFLHGPPKPSKTKTTGKYSMTPEQ